MQTKPHLAAWLCLTLFVLSLPAFAEPLPRDVQKFVDRRVDCDHVRRIKELPRELGKLCTGTDKELAQLKRKYAANSTIMQILNQFDTGIETADAVARK
jgi:predicted oxidoreductase